MISSKKLTIRYVIYQIIFFAYSAGTSSFAATYLLAKGFQASQVGVLLSLSTLMACLAQPLIGDAADRLKKFVLPQIVAAIFCGVTICLAIIQFIHPPIAVFGLLYGAALFLASVTNSLNSSLCAYYTNNGYPINYGVGQGTGSFSFSIASLGFGYLIAWLGVDSMILTALLLAITLIIVVLGYPELEVKRDTVKAGKDVKKEERVSLLQFFVKYKIFILTMVGVMLVSMCHTMSESYFIAIFEKIGGGSKDVGIAMFVACLSAVPFFLFFENIRQKIDIYVFLKLAGPFFMLKTLLIILATQAWHIYLIQLLQTFTYGFIYQPLYYMARRQISEADLVKGQAVAVSMYSLGGACGSFVGGKMLDLCGVNAMLWLAFGAAVTGAAIINMTLRKDETGCSY